jgi:hypothetical protein
VTVLSHLLPAKKAGSISLYHTECEHHLVFADLSDRWKRGFTILRNEGRVYDDPDSGGMWAILIELSSLVPLVRDGWTKPRLGKDTSSVG